MSNGDEKRAELVEHLAELRARLVRSIIYMVMGTAAAWYCYELLLEVMKRPMMSVMQQTGSKFLLTSFPEPFMVQLQICFVAGLIVSSPLIFAEIWGFVAPGLTPEEKRPVRWVAPMAAVLFFCGVTLCYMILPKAFEWFAAYVPKDAELRPSLQGSVLFSVKMLLAFGVVFELPVMLMLLAKVGLISSRMLWENWRGAMVATSVVSAIITPSNDAFSMLMMAVPVSALYFLSISLVRIVETNPGGSGLITRFSGRFKRRVR